MKWFLFTLVLLIINCRYSDVSVEEFKYIELILFESNKRIILDEKNSRAINNNFKKLSKSKFICYDKPDFLIHYYDKDKKIIKTISVFFDKGIIYDGYFLDAWTDRMMDKKSDCYKLNYRQGQLIYDLLSK